MSVNSATSVPERVVHAGDAITWLAEHAPLSRCSLITSLPDVSGLPQLSLEQWKSWFIEAARLCLEATPDDGVTIFYQTDIKHAGTWVDKAYLCQKAAERCETALLWHRVVCRRPPGQPIWGRPGYTHLLCFSRGVRDVSTPAYADVLPGTGHMTWSQAMGVNACELACDYVRSHTQSHTVVDPFCGVGTVLAVANHRGLHALGVEITAKRVRKARNLQLPQLDRQSLNTGSRQSVAGSATGSKPP
jgi:hypothetical protein